MSIFNFFKKKEAESSTVEPASELSVQKAPVQELPILDGVNNIPAPPPPAEKPLDETGEQPVEDEPQGPIDTKAVEEQIVEAIRKIFDPEIPINIYELGLIYEVKVEETGHAFVKMTFTAPNCPAAGILPGQVESQARSVKGVRDVKLELTFDPPWNPDLMSEAARLELGMF